MTTKKITDDKVDEIAKKEILTEEDVETLADWVLQEIEELDNPQ
tara:strand:- start:282 stop:413 length:132 start_codon:yes stop_codon:yes gene_type:complete